MRAHRLIVVGGSAGSPVPLMAIVEGLPTADLAAVSVSFDAQAVAAEQIETASVRQAHIADQQIEEPLIRSGSSRRFRKSAGLRVKRG